MITSIMKNISPRNIFWITDLEDINELPKVVVFKLPIGETLNYNLDFHLKEEVLSFDKVNLCRSLTTEKFHEVWRCCVGKLLNE